MKTQILFLLMILLLISSCGLDRSNPLDPFGNPEVDPPNTVEDLNVINTSSPGATQKFVTLQWKWKPPTTYRPSGFKIYRGLGYFSGYELVDTLATTYDPEDQLIIEEYSHTGVLPGDYWYKVSAYTHYGYEQPLEGRDCDPVFARVRP